MAEPDLPIDLIALFDGRVVQTHTVIACAGQRCCVHNPSQHPLNTARLHWRADRRIMERICAHGIGHPDPDDLAVRAGDGVHGCDGCCQEAAKRGSG